MLNEDQVQKIRGTLATSGWIEVMRIAILNRGKQALTALSLSPSERLAAGGEFKNADDSALRGVISTCEWMVSCWPNEITVFEINRHAEELRAQDGAQAPS